MFTSKWTFSLASLILIMALGLVFAPTAVMAHDPVSDGADKPTDIHGHPDGLTQGTHMHPTVMVSATDANPNTMGVTEIVQKADSDTNALTLEFDLLITVDKNVVAAGANLTNQATAPVKANTFSSITVVDYNDDEVSVGSIGTLAFAQADATGKPLEWTLSFMLTLADDGVATTTDAQQVTAALAAGMHFRVTVPANIIQSNRVVGDYEKQGNEKVVESFTAIAMAVDKVVEDPDPVMFVVSGTPSLTDPFTVTFTSTSMDGAKFTVDDVEITGGYIENPLSLQPDPSADPANTVWNVIVWPYPATTMVSVTITDDSSTAPAADADMGTLSLSKPKATLNSITAADGADDTGAFLVTLTFAEALPEGVMVEAADLMVTPTTATVGTPSVDAGDAKMWHVLITPTAGMDTKIELSEAGEVKFGVSDAAVTVTKKAAAIVIGDITASYDSANMETSLSGTIGANSFGVVGSAALPDLEEFFDIGGTIGLYDADAGDNNDKNSREVVMSEILWGLDFGAATIDEQTQWQFIELYNTTSDSISLDGWTIKFKEGRPVPTKDVDQVSNRSGVGWDVEAGQSGRVTGTAAVDPEVTLTAVKIYSMYRNINYDQVEKVKADGSPDPDRAGQLGGIPDGNNKDSWKESQRRDASTPDSAAARWIYASRGQQHYTTTKVLDVTQVKRDKLIINELGNGVGDTNDWVEIRNVTSSEQSLKNYHLSYIPGHNTDNSLVNFHDKDIKVPANGVILLVNTNPQNTDIAAGRNAAIADTDQIFTGATSRYYVDSNLKLPDDGKFNLILRDAHDKLKSKDNLRDVIGGLKIVDDTIGTSLWPLVATGAPHGDVVEAHGTDLKAGYVYIRKNAGGGTGEHHLGRQGYTGIGYDRAAAKSDANGGTPGYDNGAVKDKIAGLTDGDITISEIMVEVGKAHQNLAQWIELYNSSMTQSVNLAGWKLHIENAANGNGDLETNTFSTTLTLDGMTISPNQTVLIASNTGRISDPEHFPSTRVVNLWTTKKHRDALEMVRRTDPVLSSTGFNITLADKDGNEVDSVGNLDGNRRTRDDPAWMLPVGEDDGRRSSLIRVYDEGVAVNGTMAEAWVLADKTNLAFAISHTFYGDADDFGTPGFRGGGPLPVSLSKFRPERLESGEIVVRWITESELNNAGFNILRSEKRDGEFTKVHFKAGQGTTTERNVYEWTDKTAKPNVVYYYQIQDVSLDGKVTTLRQSRLKGDISPAGKLTTIWGELKALQ